MVGLNPDSLIVCPRAEDFLLTDSHMTSRAEEICRHDVILCILFAMGRGELSCGHDNFVIASLLSCWCSTDTAVLFTVDFLAFWMFVLCQVGSV